MSDMNPGSMDRVQNDDEERGGVEKDRNKQDKRSDKQGLGALDKDRNMQDKQNKQGGRSDQDDQDVEMRDGKTGKDARTSEKTGTGSDTQQNKRTDKGVDQGNKH